MDASYKHSKTPHIQIVDVSYETDTSTPNVSFEVNDAFIDMVKADKELDKINQDILSDYVYDLLEKCANEKDEFSYVTVKK
jgi:hypothetical protein